MFVKWKGNPNAAFQEGFSIYDPETGKQWAFLKGVAVEVSDSFGRMLLDRSDFDVAAAPAPVEKAKAK